jgi:hypothetical protein
MYLLTWIEEEARIEASLGGRITVEEMAVLYEELRDVLESLQDQPYLLQLDYSRAKNFDAMTTMVLEEIKDFCLSNGAAKVVSILRDEDDVTIHTNSRLQLVMEGREEFVLEPEQIAWTPPARKQRRQSRAA